MTPPPESLDEDVAILHEALDFAGMSENAYGERVPLDKGWREAFEALTRIEARLKQQLTHKFEEGALVRSVDESPEEGSTPSEKLGSYVGSNPTLLPQNQQQPVQSRYTCKYDCPQEQCSDRDKEGYFNCDCDIDPEIVVPMPTATGMKPAEEWLYEWPNNSATNGEVLKFIRAIQQDALASITPLPPCDICHQPQTQLGAVKFSPTDKPRLFEKTHICVKCDASSEAMPEAPSLAMLNAAKEACREYYYKDRPITALSIVMPSVILFNNIYKAMREAWLQQHSKMEE